MKKPPPAWHSEVFRLRAVGLNGAEISRRLGRNKVIVYWVLNERGERAATLARARRSRAGIRRGYRHFPGPILTATASNDLSEHVYRTPRQIIDRAVYAQAIIAYTRGEMTRESMLTWLAPGYRAQPWRDQ